MWYEMIVFRMMTLGYYFFLERSLGFYVSKYEREKGLPAISGSCVRLGVDMRAGTNEKSSEMLLCEDESEGERGGVGGENRKRRYQICVRLDAHHV